MEILIALIALFIVCGMVNPNVFKSWDKIREDRMKWRDIELIHLHRPDDFPEIKSGKEWHYYKDFPGEEMSWERMWELEEISPYWRILYPKEEEHLQKCLREALLKDTSGDKKIFHGGCKSCVAQDRKGIKYCFNCQYFPHNTRDMKDKSIKLKQVDIK